MNKLLVIHGDYDYQIKVRHCQANQYSVCLYRSGDWLVALGVNADSLEEAFESCKFSLLKNHHFTETSRSFE